jgi:hypothetical protein
VSALKTVGRIEHPNSQFCQFSSFDDREACFRTLPKPQIPPQEVLLHSKVKNPRLIYALGGSIALQQTHRCTGPPQAAAKSSSSCRNGGGGRARGTVPRTARISLASVAMDFTCMAPWHLGHVMMSMAKTRRNSHAHEWREGGGGGDRGGAGSNKSGCASPVGELSSFADSCGTSAQSLPS